MGILEKLDPRGKHTPEAPSSAPEAPSPVSEAPSDVNLRIYIRFFEYLDPRGKHTPEAPSSAPEAPSPALESNDPKRLKFSFVLSIGFKYVFVSRKSKKPIGKLSILHTRNRHLKTL